MLVRQAVITVHTSVQLQLQEDLNVHVEMAITSGMMDGDVEVRILYSVQSDDFGLRSWRRMGLVTLSMLHETTQTFNYYV